MAYNSITTTSVLLTAPHVWVSDIAFNRISGIVWFKNLWLKEAAQDRSGFCVLVGLGAGWPMCSGLVGWGAGIHNSSRLEAGREK